MPITESILDHDLLGPAICQSPTGLKMVSKLSPCVF